MSKSNFEQNLLNLKKTKFLEIVERTAKTLKVTVPGVIFWEENCPYYSGRERAHIHPEDLTICISVRVLKNMTYEDIEECASHEVTHLTDKHQETEEAHSPDFYRRHEDAKIASWKPPGGVVVIEGSKTTIDKVLPKIKHLIDKVNCNYHLCREKRVLKQCPYCDKYFCEEHINPFEPFVGHPSERPSSYDKDEGHPCAIYAEKKKKSAEYDYPYLCRHCGQWVEFKNRFQWAHDCVPVAKKKRFFERVFTKSEVRRPVRETYAKGYKHRVVSHNKFQKILTWIIGIGIVVAIIYWLQHM